MRRAFTCFSLFISCAGSLAQPDSMVLRDDVSMDVYLAALAQVSPAARDGAEAYMTAFAARCGRPMKAIELRRAVAEGTGNPTLMAMIRASHQRDTAALRQLSGSIACPRS
jgi:hypothetical protein